MKKNQLLLLVKILVSLYFEHQFNLTESNDRCKLIRWSSEDFAFLKGKHPKEPCGNGAETMSFLVPVSL